MISAALKNGVELYTRVHVKRIRSISPDRHYLTTDRGRIVARRVIVATNAFTRELLTEMRSISPRQSQIMLDRARGRTITTEQGPAFFNQPRAGARNGRAPLLFGGGKDRPMKNPASRRRSLGIHKLLLRLRDRYYPELCGQPPTSEWVGPMAFTPVGLPAIGFVRPGVILAVRGRRQLLAQPPLAASSGQPHHGEARNATCSMPNDGIIFELERKPCEIFLGRRRQGRLFQCSKRSIACFHPLACRRSCLVNRSPFSRILLAIPWLLRSLISGCQI
jgi:FAD dependent oxidoreductase